MNHSTRKMLARPAVCTGACGRSVLPHVHEGDRIRAVNLSSDDQRALRVARTDLHVSAIAYLRAIETRKSSTTCTTLYGRLTDDALRVAGLTGGDNRRIRTLALRKAEAAIALDPQYA